MKPAISHLN